MRTLRLTLGVLAVGALTVAAAAAAGDVASESNEKGPPTALISEGSSFTSTLGVSQSCAVRLKGSLGMGFAPTPMRAVGPAAETPVPSWTPRLETTGSSSSPRPSAPSAFAFHPVAPNPFERSTLLSFDLPRTSRVRIVTYDVRGRQVNAARSEDLGPGRYQRTWNGLDRDGRPLPPGIYLIRVAAAAVDGGQGLDAVRRLLMLR